MVMFSYDHAKRSVNDGTVLVTVFTNNFWLPPTTLCYKICVCDVISINIHVAGSFGMGAKWR